MTTSKAKNALAVALTVLIVALCGCEEIPVAYNRYGCTMYIDEVNSGVATIHAYCNDLDTARNAVLSADGVITKISHPVLMQDTYRVDGITHADVSQLENSGWRWS